MSYPIINIWYRKSPGTSLFRSQTRLFLDGPAQEAQWVRSSSGYAKVAGSSSSHVDVSLSLLFVLSLKINFLKKIVFWGVGIMNIILLFYLTLILLFNANFLKFVNILAKCYVDCCQE